MATATAAPAFALSPQCLRQTVAWSTYVGQNQQGATVTATGANASPITVKTEATGNTTAANNLSPQGGVQGGVTGYLALTLPIGTAQTETVTFSFSDPVSDLRFSLLDIDSATGSFYDSVSVSSGFTYLPLPGGSTVTGAGTPQSPFIQGNGNTNVANTSNAGNVDLRFAGPVSSVSIRYAQQINNASVPVLGISNLTFVRAGC